MGNERRQAHDVERGREDKEDDGEHPSGGGQDVGRRRIRERHQVDVVLVQGDGSRELEAVKRKDGEQSAERQNAVAWIVDAP